MRYARIRTSLTDILNRVQHLEIAVSTLIIDRIAVGSERSVGTSCMASLKAQFSKRKKFSVFLAVEIVSKEDDRAEEREWTNALSLDSSEMSPMWNVALFQDTINNLLPATRLRGPGEKKMFKLLVERPLETCLVRKLWTADRRMVWALHCDGVEFHSLGDVSGVLQQAIDNCVESK